jgi:hypothetical protein
LNLKWKLELRMNIIAKPATSTAVFLVMIGLVAGCSRNKEPETFTGSAEVGTTCVQSAAAAYGVSLDYITITAMVADPTNAYAFAYPGVVQQSTGVSKNFLCRLDADQKFIDVVTWVPKQ